LAVPEEIKDVAVPADSDPVTNGSSSFGEFYYAHDCGIPYERSEHWLTFFGAIADGIVAQLAPSTVLDVGCAMGFLVEALRARGVDAWGIDISEFAISKVHESVASFCRVSSAASELPAGFPESFDLVTCVEVIEHMDPVPAKLASANLCRWGRRVLFSSSSTDYGEPSHVNVKRGEQWAAEFAGHGYLRNFDIDVSFLTAWSVLFEPAIMTVPSVVARYEREYAEARREGLHLRHRLLDSDRIRGELEAEVASLYEELESASVKAQRDVLAKLSAARDASIAAGVRAQQLRHRVGELEEQVDARERTLWELLAELDAYRNGSRPGGSSGRPA
jgi:SAM-dependent methyltransferase